ncbi:MAG: MFS transporter [Patescibacteria group bacterium]|nr:MFS transporter [Patescibacteria group bacterium]MDE1966183.1 MFS transporter [Patescibacteria group bacterium]
MRRILTLALANSAGGLHYFILAYITSSYLGQFLPDAQIGLVYGVSAALMLIGFAAAPAVLKRFSARESALALAALDLFTLLALSANPPAALAVALVALQGMLAPLVSYTLDLFLEKATRDEGQTGHMRGMFLTSGNVALVASPLLIGLILGESSDYRRIFLTAAAAIFVFILLIAFRKKNIEDVQLEHSVSLWETFVCLVRNGETRSVLIANTILQCFFLWAPVYIPLYLHVSLGFSWSVIGPIFALMLLPFLLIELPMGYLEDSFRGARFVMAAGFLISGVSFAAVALITASTSIVTVAVILILTRVGAALIEVTSETSFFRGVSATDANSVSFFRMTRPLGMLIGPLIASAILFGISLDLLFVPLGALTLLGIPFAFGIKDD